MEKVTKLLIPSNFYQCFRNKFSLTDFAKNHLDLLNSTTSNPNAEYIIEANKDTKKHYQQLNIEPETFRKLNVKKHLRINFYNVDLLNVILSPSYVRDLGPVLWTDSINSETFSLSTQKFLNLNITDWKHVLDSSSVKNLNLSASGYVVNIQNQSNFESIKLEQNNRIIKDQKQFNYSNRPSIRIKNLKNLKELDLSGLPFVSISDFMIQSIPADCKLIFNKDFYFTQSYYKKPYSAIKLNNVTGTDKYLEDFNNPDSWHREHKSSKILITDLLGNTPIKNDKLEVSFKDFGEYIYKHSKQEIKSLYEAEQTKLKTLNSSYSINNNDISIKEVLQKPQIIIPSNIITSEYRPYQHEFSTLPQNTSFSSEDKEYVLNFVLPNQARSADIKTTQDFFDNLNIKGDLTIKTSNTFGSINSIELEFTGYNRSPRDEIPQGNIKFATEANIKFVCEPNAILKGPKSLTFQSYSNCIKLANLEQTEKIVVPKHINTSEIVKSYSSANDHQIKLNNLPNLKYLDLTGYRNFKEKHLLLHRLPKNCEIVFDPECTIEYEADWSDSFKSPLLSSLLNFQYRRDNTIKYFSLSEHFKKSSKDGFIHCTFEDFAKAIASTTQKEYDSSFEKIMASNHNAIKKNQILPTQEFPTKKIEH